MYNKLRINGVTSKSKEKNEIFINRKKTLKFSWLQLEWKKKNRKKQQMVLLYDKELIEMGNSSILCLINFV